MPAPRRTTRLPFLLALLLLAPHLTAPALAHAAERSLSLRHLHTGERLEAVYWRDGKYLPQSLAEVDRLLRDHRDGTVHPIAPALLDQLHALREKAGSSAPFEVVCGYRTPASNRHLAATTSGIGSRSYHMQGRAVDVRLPGVPLDRLREAALGMKAGGVGYYPRSDFLHLDTGPVRRW